MEKFSVKAVVRLTGINENTLRAWERRYSAFSPSRGEDGRRFYSGKDVERIQILSSLVKEGHSIGKIASLSDSVLKKMLKKSLSPQGSELSASESKNQVLLFEIISALERFKMDKLYHVLQKARFEISSKEIVINLIRPLMEQVGRLVYEKKISISQEHLLSSLLRDFLGNLNQSLSPYDFSSNKKGSTVILTTREGDIHEFGILLSSILCNLYQFRTFYLGPNMPVDDLILAAEQLNPDFIILGLMKLPIDREITSADEYVRKLDESLPRKISIYYGGPQDLSPALFKTERILSKFQSLNELDSFLSEKA